MAKLTEYEAKITLNQDDILITDGQDGTKKITAKNLANVLAGMSDKMSEVDGEVDDLKTQIDELKPKKTVTTQEPTITITDINSLTDIKK